MTTAALTKKVSKQQVQSVALIEFLHRHPDSTIHELTAAIEDQFGDEAIYTHLLISFVRNKAGEEVLTCRYSKPRKAFVYRLALSAQESFEYVKQRKVKVRNETANLVGILDRTEAKYPGDADIRIARAMLQSVVTILDAGAGV